MINQIKNIKEKVIHLLTTIPHLRDSDDKLIATIWNIEIGKDEKGLNKSEQMITMDFLKAFAEGKHSNPETIRRSRQLIQAQMPHLRGKSYTARKESANQFKQQIHEV